MGIMDAWKRGRIIYAYLIWVVFKATTAGGLYGEYTSRLSVKLENRFSRGNGERRVIAQITTLIRTE